MNSSALENIPLHLDSKYHKERRNLKLQPGFGPKETLVNWTWWINQVLFVENLNTYIVYMCPLKLSQHRNPIQLSNSWVFSMCLTLQREKPTCPQVALFCILCWLLLVCIIFKIFFSSNIISYAFLFRQWQSPNFYFNEKSWWNSP